MRRISPFSLPDAEPGFLAELKPTAIAPPAKPDDEIELLQLETNGDPLSTIGKNSVDGVTQHLRERALLSRLRRESLDADLW